MPAKERDCQDRLSTFGNFITGSIHGVKFHDLDGDGVFDKTRSTPARTSRGFKASSSICSNLSRRRCTVKATGGGTVIEV